MTWTRIVRRLIVAYGVAVLVAGWVVLVWVLAAAYATGEPVLVDPNAFGERNLELVLFTAAGPAVGWAIRASIESERDAP